MGAILAEPKDSEIENYLTNTPISKGKSTLQNPSLNIVNVLFLLLIALFTELLSTNETSSIKRC